ncbi:MAG: hypothetical protein ACYDBV_14825 [Nitrospiria bacterium]
MFLITVFLLAALSFSGKSVAFPGEEWNQFLTEHGNPGNLKENQAYLENQAKKNDKKNERLIDYYWLETEADPLLLNRKIKGNLIVIFEKQTSKNPETQNNSLLTLKSHQETFLSHIGDSDFKNIERRLTKKWRVISKTHHENPNRSYDLYHLISNDRRYLGEMSYSPLDKVVPFKSNEAHLQAPLLNLWIHISKRDQ